MRRRLPTIAIIVIGLAGLVLFYRYGIMKSTATIKELKDKHAAYTDSVNTARTVAERLDEMKMRVRIAELQWEKATEMLPTAKEIPDLLTAITQVGAKSNVSFRLFQPNPMRQEDIYKALPIKITVASTYHDLGLFLTAIGNLPRIVNVDEVRVGTSTEEGTTVLTDFVATTYLLSEEKAKVATEQRARKRP